MPIILHPSTLRGQFQSAPGLLPGLRGARSAMGEEAGWAHYAERPTRAWYLRCLGLGRLGMKGRKKAC